MNFFRHLFSDFEKWKIKKDAEGYAVFVRAPLNWLEEQLEKERDQIALWLPIAFGAGILLWFTIPSLDGWLASGCLLGALILAMLPFREKARVANALMIAAIAAIGGLINIGFRAYDVPRESPLNWGVCVIYGQIQQSQQQPARNRLRLLMAVDRDEIENHCQNHRKTHRKSDTAFENFEQQDKQQDKDNLELGDEKLETDSKKSRIQKPAHPLLIRLSVSDRYNGAGLEAGAFISVKAKLERPMPASLPSGYDYAEVAYFQNIVATGHALEQPRLVKTADPSSFFLKMAAIHQQLTRHIIQKTGAESGPIAAAFVTNDVGSISDSDNIAMRKAGLTHLLSVGGMHIAVVIGAVIFISIRLLALFPYLALHYPLRLIAAINGAFIGLIYTFIAGCEIPTVRSMLTAALILWGIALGRRAFSLRLVAAAAMIIMIFRPESVLSPSFQLSFAAVTTVIAFAEAPEVKRLFEHYEVGWLKKIALIAGEILLSGAVVEAVVAPITIYHFHQSGLYGAIANILAIPLTTFIIIPAEAAALATDVIGCSAPFWWITAYGIHFLLVIAHYVAALPMAGIMLPMMQASTCLLLMMGWLWLGLWKSRWRLWGIALLLLGLMIVIFTPRPDVLINRDGETIVFKTNPRPLSYRFIWAKNNPYNQDQAATILGFEKAQQSPPFHESACQKSPCIVKTDDQRHALLVIRGKAKSPLISLCETSDLVISDQILPESCHPKIAKIDPCMLIKTGGMALYWSPKKQGFPQIITTQSGHDQHPWIKSILPVACRS